MCASIISDSHLKRDIEADVSSFVAGTNNDLGGFGPHPTPSGLGCAQPLDLYDIMERDIVLENHKDLPQNVDAFIKDSLAFSPCETGCQSSILDSLDSYVTGPVTSEIMGSHLDPVTECLYGSSSADSLQVFGVSDNLDNDSIGMENS